MIITNILSPPLPHSFAYPSIAFYHEPNDLDTATTTTTLKTRQPRCYTYLDTLEEVNRLANALKVRRRRRRRRRGRKRRREEEREERRSRWKRRRRRRRKRKRI